MEDMFSISVKVGRAQMNLSALGEEPIKLQDLLCALEREVLVQMLARKNGVKARAAEALSLLRTTLVEKVKKYEITL